jgi:hypothetical protein
MDSEPALQPATLTEAYPGMTNFEEIGYLFAG